MHIQLYSCYSRGIAVRCASPIDPSPIAPPASSFAAFRRRGIRAEVELNKPIQSPCRGGQDWHDSRGYAGFFFFYDRPGLHKLVFFDLVIRSPFFFLFLFSPPRW